MWGMKVVPFVTMTPGAYTPPLPVVGESGTTQLPRDGHANTERGRVGLPWTPLCCSILQPAWTSGTPDHLALKPRIILHAGLQLKIHC